MAKISNSKRRLTTDQAARSTQDGQVVVKALTPEEAEARSRFLAVASLSAVPKKSRITQAQARKAVSKFFETRARPAASA